jgi:glycosyltransferase involved in cell wall biosynthesis
MNNSDFEYKVKDQGGKIAYLLGDFPVTSETFVLGEVVRLRKHGLPVQIVSLGRHRSANAKMLRELTEIGGCVEYIRDNLIERFIREGLPFVLRHPYRTLSAAVESWRMPVLASVSNSKHGRWLKAVTCAGMIHRRGIAHLHAHWLVPTEIAMIAARAAGITFSYTAHASDIYDHAAAYDRLQPGSGTHNRIARAAFVATCTAANVAHFRQVAPDVVHNIHLIYHGVDLARFDGRRTPTDNAPPLILSVGRLVALKGFDTLVEACRELSSRGLIYQCVIVGDGPERASLEARVRECSLENRIRFVGSQPQDIVRDWLRRADVFVLCGKPELGQYGLPNVLLEAMAMGVATVATRLPTLDELIIDGVDGHIVDDVSDLSLVLAKLLADPAEQQRLGTTGRERIIKMYDADRTIGQLIHLLKRATEVKSLPTLDPVADRSE